MFDLREIMRTKYKFESQGENYPKYPKYILRPLIQS